MIESNFTDWGQEELQFSVHRRLDVCPHKEHWPEELRESVQKITTKQLCYSTRNCLQSWTLSKAVCPTARLYI